MTRKLIAILPLMLALLIAGCAKKEEAAAPGKHYPMQGVIKALDAPSHSATIDAGKIGDWMDAMTMDYPIKPDAEFQKLHVGDKIEATVIVGDPAYYVTDIKVVK
ncbi:MAG: copper-binding protein [Candidatus Solibacter sp.]